MTEHAPKLRALRALHARQLSAASATRLERHLAGCATCSEALRGLRLAARLIEDARAGDPELDFAHLSAGLERRLSRELRLRILRAAAILPLAAAAAGLLFWLRPQPPAAPEPARSAQLTAPPAPPAPAEVFEASVTALAGEGSLQPASGEAVPLRIDSVLHEGDRLQLQPEALAHLRLDRATGCVLGGDSELRLLRLGRGETELELSRGRLVSRVQPLTAAQFYRVRAAGYAVSVLGTHFEVQAVDDKLDVMVAEGHVLVQDAEGRVVADLHARDHFAIDRTFGARLATRDASHPSLQLEQPRALGIELGEWPHVELLDVRALERYGVTALTLDGSRFPLSGEIAVRVPRGDVELIATRLTTVPQKIVLFVPPEGLALAPDALRKLLKLQPPEAASPRRELDFEAVLGVVRAGTGDLQRCYERALKRQPDLDGRLTLRVSLDARGGVAQAQPRSDAPLPADLVECLRNVARRWHFPASPASLAFDIPLRLQPR